MGVSAVYLNEHLSISNMLRHLTRFRDWRYNSTIHKYQSNMTTFTLIYLLD